MKINISLGGRARREMVCRTEVCLCLWAAARRKHKSTKRFLETFPAPPGVLPVILSTPGVGLLWLGRPAAKPGRTAGPRSRSPSGEGRAGVGLGELSCPLAVLSCVPGTALPSPCTVAERSWAGVRPATETLQNSQITEMLMPSGVSVTVYGVCVGRGMHMWPEGCYSTR